MRRCTDRHEGPGPIPGGIEVVEAALRCSVRTLSRDLAGAVHPGASAVGLQDALGHLSAIFESDHSFSLSSRLSKIAESFFDSTSSAAASARALS